MIINGRHIRTFLSNLAIALFLNSQFIIRIAQAYIPAVGGIGVKLVFILSFILAILALRKIEVRKIHVIIPIVIILFFMVTVVVFPGRSELKLFELLIYCVLPFVLVWNELEFNKIVKFTLVLTCPAIFVLSKVFIRYNTVNYAITMVLSHAVVPSIICAIAYIVYYIEFDKGITKLLYIALCLVNIVYFYELITYGSRSSVIAVLFFVIVIAFFRPDFDNNRIRAHRIRLFLLSSIVLLVFYLYGERILSWILYFLESHGIYNRFIRKYYNLMLLGDISHGRTDIYKVAFDGFLSNPVCGHGIDMFFANTGIAFPHNFVLQFAYDGGILLLSTIVIPLVYSSIRLLKLNRYDLFMPWMILFCSSIPIVMVSGDIWIKYVFWFLLAFAITHTKASNYSLVPDAELKTE